MEKIDIKALARELKGEGTESKPITTSDKKGNHRPTNKKKPRVISPNNTDFLDLISKINNHIEYNTEGCVYIDSDIHDLLRQIKVRKKLKIGYLVSWLIERFIQEHRENIASLLKPTENRFMEK